MTHSSAAAINRRRGMASAQLAMPVFGNYRPALHASWMMTWSASCTERHVAAYIRIPRTIPARRQA